MRVREQGECPAAFTTLYTFDTFHVVLKKPKACNPLAKHPALHQCPCPPSTKSLCGGIRSAQTCTTARRRAR